jgi:hypothetical protein
VFISKLFANNAISFYETRFWNPIFVKVGGVPVFTLCWGGKGKFPDYREFAKLTLRRRFAVLRAYYNLAIKFTPKCMQTYKINKQTSRTFGGKDG